jgi:serine protease Do
VVERVDAGSAAADAGVQRGDIILEVGDEKIANAGDFRQRVTELARNSEAILFRVERGDARMFIAVEPEK